jgi:hypothetical protein
VIEKGTPFTPAFFMWLSILKSCLLPILPVDDNGSIQRGASVLELANWTENQTMKKTTKKTSPCFGF